MKEKNVENAGAPASSGKAEGGRLKKTVGLVIAEGACEGWFLCVHHGGWRIGKILKIHPRKKTVCVGFFKPSTMDYTDKNHITFETPVEAVYNPTGELVWKFVHEISKKRRR